MSCEGRHGVTTAIEIMIMIARAAAGRRQRVVAAATARRSDAARCSGDSEVAAAARWRRQLEGHFLRSGSPLLPHFSRRGSSLLPLFFCAARGAGMSIPGGTTYVGELLYGLAVFGVILVLCDLSWPGYNPG